ncbi:MAG: biotin--[acetyl-CoA-carboxylase] ligase [Eubacteriales bacterium]
MKTKVLSLLKKKYPDYVSGEEISRQLGISRTAVWKHMRKLKESGYDIEAHSKVGYRLIQTPDRLYEHELTALLKSSVLGKKIVYRETVGSTNELAKELAQKGAQQGTVVIAEEQTGGKGRMGRIWYSPAGQGLWFSVILRPRISPVDATKLTLVCAVAVANAVREITGLAAGIKWPNDILIDNRKAAGILTEMSAEIDKVNYMVLGIGINVNFNSKTVPSDLAGIAMSLDEQTNTKISRIDLLAAVLNNLDMLYQDFTQGKFAAILSAWKEMSVTLNRWVKVVSPNTVDEGIAFDIDDEGILILMKKDGSMKRILSGDVSLR